MIRPLKDLLPDAVKRAHIAKPLAGVRVIDEANGFLRENLPLARNQDAKAIYFRDGLLMIACLNGSAADYIAKQQDEMMNFLKKSLPDCDLKRIHTKVVSQFPEKDFMVK